MSFSNTFLSHFRNPRNVGTLPSLDPIRVENPVCGDILLLSVSWNGDTIADARYKVSGCAASIAAGSALTELLLHRTRAELASLNAAAIEAALDGLPPESHHAAVLCADAVKRLYSSKDR